MNIATRLTEVLTQHRARLRALVGQPVESSRVVWYAPWDGMHAASPVVLRVGGRNLELWSIAAAEFGFTWDELDLKRAPFYWVGHQDPQSSWAEDAVGPLWRARGQVIRGVRLISADNRCGGVEFAFDGWALTLFTESDTMQITDQALAFKPQWVAV
ncbi:MAG TPA: hypothetical protein VKE74_27740 [Gemmataceae bacterium]|nr:hypothetical protein [Gemmataceae bacterium]